MKIDKDTQLGNLYAMWQESDRENAIKLEQILDLEEILYKTRILDLKDKSPCWCSYNPNYEPKNHEDFCIKARQATEPFWKKS